jgi:hypothetical protein
MTFEQAIEISRELAEQLSDDIQKCSTREEHIRVTARANAAAALYNGLIGSRREME